MATTQDQIPITTTDQVQHQTVQNIKQQLKQMTGQDHQVQPVTAETPLDVQVEGEGDTVEHFVDRAVWGRPGQEPSKSFLKKMWEMMRKKHPDKEVKLK